MKIQHQKEIYTWQIEIEVEVEIQTETKTGIGIEMETETKTGIGIEIEAETKTGIQIGNRAIRAGLMIPGPIALSGAWNPARAEIPGPTGGPLWGMEIQPELRSWRETFGEH